MYSETPDIIPFTSPFKSALLTQAELETLKRGTLHVLNEVGVYFPSRTALEIFAEHGAQVDWKTENGPHPTRFGGEGDVHSAPFLCSGGTRGALRSAAGWQLHLPVYRRNRRTRH
jgi:hypothetical protein